MSRPLFTPEELEEMRRADEEIDSEFMITREEREAGDERDRRSKAENSYGSDAAKRRYRAANREKRAARQRRYYAANRVKCAAYQREYRAANPGKAAAYQRKYRAASRKNIPAAPREALRSYRKRIGFSQAKLAALIGVSGSTIGSWEIGVAPINLLAVEAALPELAEEIRRAAG